MLSDKKWDVNLRRSGQSVFNNSICIDIFYDGYIAFQELRGSKGLIITEKGLIVRKISKDLTHRIERNGESKHSRY